MTSLLLWQKIEFDGSIHKPHYDGDAGFDLVVSRYIYLDAGKPIPSQVPCGIRIALPEDVAAFVISRSSAVQKGILVVPTLIDPGWRGDMHVFAYNMGDIRIALDPGDRIAQLVPIPALAQSMALKEVVDGSLPPSSRGTSGFGSTGGIPSG